MIFILLFPNRLTKAGFPSQTAWLQGTISTAKDDVARKVDVNNFDYILPDGPSVSNKKNGASKTNGTDNNGKETKNKLDEYKESLRDFQNNQISKLGNSLDLTSHGITHSHTFLNFQTWPMPKTFTRI